MRLINIFIVWIMCTTATAAGIYKWIDEQGNVHFSQTPPNISDTKRVGDTVGESEEFTVTPVGGCTTLNQLLIGDWRGKDKDKRIVFRFYNHRGMFPGEKTDKRYYIDYGRQGQLQGGFWTTKGPDVKFRIKKIGGAAKKRTTIEKAMVAKIDYENLILLVGKEEFRLKRYTGSGNRPRCSKK
jgi:hypothetical protein